MSCEQFAVVLILVLFDDRKRKVQSILCAQVVSTQMLVRVFPDFIEHGSEGGGLTMKNHTTRRPNQSETSSPFSFL